MKQKNADHRLPWTKAGKPVDYEEGVSHMDRRILEIRKNIEKCCLEIFSENLTGIYIHGSLALGCFNWEKSDIDFIVVVKEPPTLRQKEQFIEELLEIDKVSPPKGLEMSLVLEKYTRNFVYPTPFELHFSNAHKQKCMNHIEEYCRSMHGTDKDLAAHFTVIRKACITVYGESEKEVFGEIPRSAYLDSIKFDIENGEDEIKENPVYIILNLCRVLAYRRNNLILSKKEGGYWGIENLPAKYAGIIKEAVKCYQSSDLFSACITDDLLTDFAEYMHQKIFGEAEKAGKESARMKERENLFNSICDTYDKSRPDYPMELYEDIFRKKQISAGSQVLEIGIGTGKATLPILETGCRLTAIEPGDKLAVFAGNKFQNYPNITICNQTFQEYKCPPESYDLIFSATAFHWIPEDEGYPKVYDLLKRGGVFARFGYYAGRDRGRLRLTKEIQRLYETYMRVTEEPREYCGEDAKKLADTAEKYGFTGIDFKLYHWTRDFCAEEYLGLLRTYPDHMAMEEAVREEFFEKMYETIQRYGGVITVYYTMDLQIAVKP